MGGEELTDRAIGQKVDKGHPQEMGTTREYLQWLSEPSVWLRAKIKKRPAGNSFW
jgi:hypothetical protein